MKPEQLCEIVLEAAQALKDAERYGAGCWEDLVERLLSFAEFQKHQPDHFTHKRAQLEQEWVQLQAMKEAYTSQDSRIAELEASRDEWMELAHRSEKMRDQLAAKLKALEARVEEAEERGFRASEAHVMTMQRAMEAEAKLKQLEEQEPVAYFSGPAYCWARDKPVNFSVAGWNPLYAPPVSTSDDKRDAERYRFLRDEAYDAVIPHGQMLMGVRTAWITKLHPGETFDAAIDAAMAGETK